MKTDNSKPVSGLKALTGSLSRRETGDSDVVKNLEPVTLRHDGRRGYRLETRRPEALVIHCGDARFQTAFRQFVTEELGIAHYLPIVIGGGVHAFGLQNLLPKNFKILWQQIKHALTVDKLNEVIIINHEDCLWYEKLKGYHPTVSIRNKGVLDLRTAAERILHDFSGVRVRTFWAAIQDNQVVFSET